MSLLEHSIFNKVFFGSQTQVSEDLDSDLTLRRQIFFDVSATRKLADIDWVIFDTETTGLDFELDRIIEFGAKRYRKGKCVDQFESLVKTDVEITPVIERLTGIRPVMLENAASIEDVLKNFLRFIKDSVIVAHNADFDISMLKAECNRQSIDFQWPVVCTLKMTRKLLTGLENYKLDTLASHFDLKFTERHRAVGDVEVLASIFQKLMDEESNELDVWSDLTDFKV